MLLFIDNATDALYYDQLTQLEGFEYLLTFIWSDAENAWYMNMSDQDGNLIAAGIRLVCGVPLLRAFHDPRLPPGEFFVVDMNDTGNDLDAPGDLQVNFPLVYVTSDDVLLGGSST